VNSKCVEWLHEGEEILGIILRGHVTMT